MVTGKTIYNTDKAIFEIKILYKSKDSLIIKIFEEFFKTIFGNSIEECSERIGLMVREHLH